MRCFRLHGQEEEKCMNWKEKKINLIAATLGKKRNLAQPCFHRLHSVTPALILEPYHYFFHHTGHKSQWSVVWLQELTMLWGNIDRAHFSQEECDGLISIEGYWWAGEPHYKWSRQYFMSEYPFIVSASVCGTCLSKERKGVNNLKKT